MDNNMKAALHELRECAENLASAAVALEKAEDKRTKVTIVAFLDSAGDQHQIGYVSKADARTRLDYPLGYIMNAPLIDTEFFDTAEEAFKNTRKYCSWDDIYVLLEDGKWHSYIPVDRMAAQYERAV